MDDFSVLYQVLSRGDIVPTEQCVVVQALIENGASTAIYNVSINACCTNR